MCYINDLLQKHLKKFIFSLNKTLKKIVFSLNKLEFSLNKNS